MSSSQVQTVSRWVRSGRGRDTGRLLLLLNHDEAYREDPGMVNRNFAEARKFLVSLLKAVQEDLFPDGKLQPLEALYRAEGCDLTWEEWVAIKARLLCNNAPVAADDGALLAQCRGGTLVVAVCALPGRDEEAWVRLRAAVQAVLVMERHRLVHGLLSCATNVLKPRLEFLTALARPSDGSAKALEWKPVLRAVCEFASAELPMLMDAVKAKLESAG